jgi:hypothetical protein
MILPPFPRHDWRPTPIGYEPIPQHAHMTYGHPREGTITTFGWRADGSSEVEYDTFRVCLPDTITVIPVFRTAEELRRCGVTGDAPDMPLFGIQYPKGASAIQFAHYPVGLRENPQKTAKRILAERFNLTAQHMTPTLVYQPDARVDSLSYTFLAFDMKLVKAPRKVLEIPTNLVHVRHAFSDASVGTIRGECEFARRIVLSHGHANCTPIFRTNVSHNITAYALQGPACNAWQQQRGTPPEQ